MPIYEYRCGSCGFQKEFLQRISDAPLTDCPQCKKSALSKMVTAAGFQLKGSGWYATDFKNSGASAPAAKGTDKPAETAKAGETAKTGETAKAAEAPAAAAATSGAGACPT